MRDLGALQGKPSRCAFDFTYLWGAGTAGRKEHKVISHGILRPAIAFVLFALLGSSASASEGLCESSLSRGHAALAGVTISCNALVSSRQSRVGISDVAGGAEQYGSPPVISLEASRLLAGGSGFACGPELICYEDTQYCSVVIGGPEGTAPGYDCLDLPEGAAPGSCEALPNIGIGCECSDDGLGVTVTCTAP